MIDLSGKVAVITGASRGLGAGIAKECQRQNMNLSVCARTRPPIDEGPRILCMAADVTDPKAVQRLADETVARFGRIDLWINNAGVLDPVGPLRKLAAADIQRHLNINLAGTFFGTQSFIKHLRKREGDGVLINISSGASTSAYSGWSAYCAGKAGVDRLTEVVQEEERDAGLRAYAVAPGIIDTDMQALIRSQSEEDFPMVEKFHELKRDDAFSSAEFVAKELLALAFDPAKRPDSVCLRLPPGK